MSSSSFHSDQDEPQEGDFLEYYATLNNDRYFSTNSPHAVTTTNGPNRRTNSKLKIKAINYDMSSNFRFRSRSVVMPMPTDVAIMKQKRLISDENNKVNLSEQTWISHQLRLKQSERAFRGISQTIQNVKAVQSLQLADRGVGSSTRPSEFARVKVQEELGMVHLEPCECCQLEYLPINLPFCVPRKAIQDVQRQRIASLGTTDHTTTTSYSPLSNRARVKQYDTCHVCRFCSQFFRSPDDYRRSYAQEAEEARRQMQLAIQAREDLKLDPLLALEMNRKRQNYEGYS